MSYTLFVKPKTRIILNQVYNTNIMVQKSKIKSSSSQDKHSLGKRIAMLRKEMKHSQIELAKKLETSQKVISDYELDKLRPHYENIIKLAFIFGITTDELLGVKKIKSNGTNIPSKKILRRMKKIETLPLSQQKFILRTIDSHLKSLEK